MACRRRSLSTFVDRAGLLEDVVSLTQNIRHPHYVRARGAAALGAILVALLAGAPCALAGTTLRLKNSFISKYKNRTSITATTTVFAAHPHAKPQSQDGDIHVASRAPEIGLNFIAELMNARNHADGVTAFNNAKASGDPITVTGAWRLWCEHGGDGEQNQGGTLEKIVNTNPDHVFEIHPVTKIDDEKFLDSFVPIEGYTPKGAEEAFYRYENARCRIIPGKTNTTLLVNMVGYNYAEFVLELLDDDQFVVDDGRMVFASVLSLDGDVLVHKRRMVFVKGTPPELAVRGLHAGDQLHVLGIPRINLTLVAWRAAHAKQRPEVLNWDLPYEMIVVGVYPE